MLAPGKLFFPGARHNVQSEIHTIRLMRTKSCPKASDRPEREILSRAISFVALANRHRGVLNACTLGLCHLLLLVCLGVDFGLSLFQNTKTVPVKPIP